MWVVGFWRHGKWLRIATERCRKEEQAFRGSNGWRQKRQRDKDGSHDEAGFSLDELTDEAFAGERRTGL